MSFYGIVGFITFYVLPQMGITNSRWVQFGIVATLIVLTLPLMLIMGLVAARKRKKERLAEEAAAAEGTDAAPVAAKTSNAPAAAVMPAGLAEGAEEVVQFLKTSNLGADGKEAIYSLPWYIIAGDTKSGKSSFVIGSNLNVQQLPSQRLAEQKFVRPTALVDWRVTSEAVFVDTAGKHFADTGSADEWSALLDTLKKHRPQRPLDGFILVVDAAKILSSDERESEELAKTLRSRLDDAITRYKIKFPVYLVFTNADSIEGFRDSFSTSKKEDKTLVWGTTIPIENSENAQALFDAEYELLLNSLMKRRISRLSAPFPPVRQLRIFNFPLHFGSARRKFSSFVNALFRPNPFSENPFLRGFYFTSSPIGKAVGNTPPSVGNTYFTERLMKDVILRDKDLTRTFLDHKKRAPIMGWVITVLGALLVGVFLVMSAVSLVSNKQLLNEAQAVGESAITIRKADVGRGDILKKDERETREEINAIENLRNELARLDRYEQEGPPLTLRFGLYSGTAIKDKALLNIYYSMVEKRFKEPAVAKLTADLQAFVKNQNTIASSSTELSEKDEETLATQFNRFKVYMMLSSKYRDKADAALISQVLKDYWLTESKVPATMKPVALQQLDFWSQHVNDAVAGDKSPGIQLDENLVKAAREKLTAFPPVYRYYSKVISDISKQVDASGNVMSVDAILSRYGVDGSLMTGTTQVAGAYTQAGNVLMKKAIADAQVEIGKEDWVMGDVGQGQAVAKTTDAAWLTDRYYRDYADQWRRFVRGVSVKPYSKENVSPALQTFSSNSSPMTILFKEIDNNTNLSKKPEGLGFIDWIKSFFTSPTTKDTGGNTQVEKDFRPLFDFIEEKEGKQKLPVESYKTELGKLQNKVAKNSGKMKEIAEKLPEDPDYILGIASSENAINGMMQTFNETAASQEMAALLMQPITRLKELLGADARTQMQKAWTDQVLPAAKGIESGYPFGDGTSDADLTKVTEFLNPESGILSKFYDDKLARYFEESNGQLKVVATSEVQFSDEFVAYLNNAFALRKALFGTSATPKFEYEFKLNPSTGAIVEVTIDGQKVTNEGTGSITGTFPASGSAETGVIINLASTSSTTSTGTANSNTAAPAAPSDQSQKFAGNWGLFRFVDAGSPKKQAGGEYLLNYSVGGKGVSAVIKPNGGDLFDKNTFRQVRAPETFLK